MSNGRSIKVSKKELGLAVLAFGCSLPSLISADLVVTIPGLVIAAAACIYLAYHHEGSEFKRSVFAVIATGVFIAIGYVDISRYNKPIAKVPPNNKPSTKDKQAAIKILWRDPPPIIEGTRLSTSQLNATTNVDGKFVYTPGIGAILPVGTQDLQARFIPVDSNYDQIIRVVSLVVNPKEVSRTDKQLHHGNGVIEDQLRIIKSIDEFIVKKNEGELRDTFDFLNILKYNIQSIKRTLFPNLISTAQSEAIDNYMKTASGRIDLRYVHALTVNNRTTLTGIPGKIYALNTSEIYTESRHRLTEFFNSSEVPASIAIPLKELDKTVEQDTVLMLESLNDSMSAYPLNIPGNEISAGSLYWFRFVSLRSKVDDIASAIRLYIERPM